MRINSLLPIIAFSILLSKECLAQDLPIKGNWEIGLHGSPVFGIKSADVENRFKGGFISATIGYYPLEKLLIGAMPFFGVVNNRTSVGYDPIANENWGVKDQKYNSYGINIFTKYYPMRWKKWSPYIQLLAGIGDTYLDQLQTNRSGGIDYDEILRYTTSNLGAGLGVSVKIMNTTFIDASLLYSIITATKDPEPTHFAFPTLGISKLLR